MKHTSLPRVFVLIASIAVFSAFAQAQQASPGVTAASTTQATPSNVIAFSDSLPGQSDGAITATFALYPDAQSTTPAWTETQLVQIIQGKYSVLLGSATANGIPADVFAADQAHWLGVQINGAEKRYLLVSVPFAIKAMEAERLGGLLPSQFVTTAQLQAPCSPRLHQVRLQPRVGRRPLPDLWPMPRSTRRSRQLIFPTTTLRKSCW